MLSCRVVAVLLILFPVSVLAQRPACEWCPVLDTPKVLNWEISIADASEPGDRIEISGVIKKADGVTPAANTIVYLYHTNAKGVYPHPSSDSRSSHAYWHGYLRGWLKTNERGEYRFRTIKPASYPNSNIPAHIHCVVKPENDSIGYYVDDFLFHGDPFIESSQDGSASTHVVKLTQASGGLLVGRRDLKLR